MVLLQITKVYSYMLVELPCIFRTSFLFPLAINKTEIKCGLILHCKIKKSVSGHIVA